MVSWREDAYTFKGLVKGIAISTVLACPQQPTILHPTWSVTWLVILLSLMPNDHLDHGFKGPLFPSNTNLNLHLSSVILNRGSVRFLEIWSRIS